VASSPTSHLGPGDAVVAVRSFPRRFRALLAPPAGDDDRSDPDELARRAGPDGRSAVDHLLAADAVLALLDRSLALARSQDDPALPPELADLGAVRADDPRTPLAGLLDRLAATAGAGAARIEDVPTDDWGRPVRVGGGDRQLLDVVREAVDVVAGHLRATERTLAAVR